MFLKNLLQRWGLLPRDSIVLMERTLDMTIGDFNLGKS